MKKVLFLLILSLLMLMTACSEEKLNDYEQDFVNSFVSILPSFRDPNNVSIRSLDASYCSGNLIVITVTDANEYGGYTFEQYCYVIHTLTPDDPYVKVNAGTIILYSKVIEEGISIHGSTTGSLYYYLKHTPADQAIDFNIGKVNKEIHKYAENKGW